MTCRGPQALSRPVLSDLRCDMRGLVNEDGIRMQIGDLGVLQRGAVMIAGIDHRIMRVARPLKRGLEFAGLRIIQERRQLGVPCGR